MIACCSAQLHKALFSYHLIASYDLTAGGGSAGGVGGWGHGSQS